MRKLSSMLALGLALALTFGMNVSAAGSATTEGTAPAMTEEVKQEYTNIAASQAAATTVTATVDGQAVTVTKAPVQPETLLQAVQVGAEKVAANAAALGIKIPENKTVQTTVVGSADISIPEGTDISKGIELTIAIDGIKAGRNYVLLHLTEKGVWETIKPSSIADGKVTANFTSLSPVIASQVVLVDLNKDVDEDEEEEDTTQAAAQAAVNPATSPKTAETLPVAGVMALISLAGAAVCAGKIRYNK